MNGERPFPGSTRTRDVFASPRTVALGLAVACLIACVGAMVRTVQLRDSVFTEQGVRLQDNDPWYHLRRVQYQARHFPDPLDVDPYGRYPSPQATVVAPFSDLLTSAIVVVLYGKDATEREVATVCAVLPPIAAGLAVIAVYLLGLMLRNQRTGLMAAAVLAVCPSLFFLHSLLGSADHHVWEVVWSTGFLAAALHLVSRREKEVDVSGAKHRFLMPGGWVIQIVAGALLAFYLMTWVGGVYLLAIVGIWILARHVVRHLRDQGSSGLSFSLLGAVLTALVLVLLLSGPYPMRGLQLCGLLGVGLLPFLLPPFSGLLVRLGLRRFWIIPCLAGLLLAAGVGLRFLAPSYYAQGYTAVRLFAGSPKGETIGEVVSIFREGGLISLGPIWALFATGFPLACAGWFVCLARAVRHGRDGDILLTVWSAVTFASMAGQGRFAYYASVTVALLVAVLVDAILVGILGSRGNVRRNAGPSRRRHGLGRRVAQASLVAWAIALVFGPGLIALPRFMEFFDGPSQGWMDALAYVRRETPEPYGDPATYFASSKSLQADRSSPESVGPYGVLSWWDYGYWITAVARRIPCANPTQAGADTAAQFLTAQDEADAVRILDAVGARYVIVDWAMAAQLAPGSEGTNSKFDAMAMWADRPLGNYYERFLLPTETGTLVPVYLYYPAYFQSMAARLYVFGGDAIPASRTLVVGYERTVDANGHPVKRVTHLTAESDYDEANAMLKQLPPDTAALVSDTPFSSCVPVASLKNIKPVFDSSSVMVAPEGTTLPEVRVFAYEPSVLAVPD